MQIKPEILSVLEALGADEIEIGSLVTYFTARLTDAESTVETLTNNIASLQVQLTEAQALVEIVRTGISKFVDLDAPDV